MCCQNEHWHAHTHARTNAQRTNAQTHKRTSGHLVPAGPQWLEEAESIDGDQGSGVEDTQLFMLEDTEEENRLWLHGKWCIYIHSTFNLDHTHIQTPMAEETMQGSNLHTGSN